MEPAPDVYARLLARVNEYKPHEIAFILAVFVEKAVREGRITMP